jgi:hypothetical protein
MTASQALAANFNQPSLSAEALLGNLAQAKKTNRIIGGITLTALGIGTGALVSTIDSDDYNNKDDAETVKTVGYICAGIITGGGIITLALPSEAENHYRDVKMIDDTGARENAAYGSLVFLAEKAKTERMMSGTVSAGMAFYYLFAADPVYYYDGTPSDYNTYCGLVFAAGAVSSLFIQSVEEKVLEQYERGYAVDEGQNRPQLRMGWLPNGSLSAVYSYQF